MPVVRLYDGEMIAASVTVVLGLAALAWSSVAGTALIALGGLRILWRCVIARRRRRDRGKHADLHLDPRIRKVTVVETLKGTAELDRAHDYRAQVDDVSGRITVTAAWGRAHWVRVSNHRRRRHIDLDKDVSFAAGSLVLRGSGALTLRPITAGHINDRTTVVLRPSTADHPSLRPPGGHGDAQWPFTVDYDLTRPDDGWIMPVWLTPTIVPESDRRALELEVQWRTLDPAREIDLTMKAIELLRITVPATWGEVEESTTGESITVSSPAVDDATGESRRSIEWKKPPVVKNNRGSCRLAIRFADRIDATTHLTGHLEARFSGTLSRTEGVAVFNAGGTRRTDGLKPKPTTLIELDFDLSLAAVRYQDVRSVPDRSRAQDLILPEHEEFPGVVPDHHTVAQLTNNLSNEGYYVKRVVENPPKPAVPAGVMNRFWDIAGRLYDGLHPIDFHLVLTGDELRKGSLTTGTTTVGLTVRGTYATPEMEERILREWTQLWVRIRSCLGPAEVARGAGPGRSAEGSIDASTAELARLRNVAVSLCARLEGAVDDSEMNSSVAAELIQRIDDEFGLGAGPVRRE